MTLASDIAALERLELERGAALMAGDIDKLATLVAEDLVHIHLNGQIDDKATYLGGVRDKYRFHNVVRGPLNIRVYADVAIMVGTLTQQVTVKPTGATLDIKAITTQAWLRTADGWIQTTCHSAPLPA